MAKRLTVKTVAHPDLLPVKNGEKGRRAAAEGLEV